MNYLLSFATSLKTALDTLYATLTVFLQNINLDEKLQFFCEYHLVVSFTVFALMLVYFIFYDKKQSYLNFTYPKNIIIFLLFFPIYYLTASKNINLEALGLGSVAIHSFILVVLGKLYGPIMTGAFGGAEYIISYIISPGSPLMISMFFIYAIGGFVQGWILYEYKTSFWRCFLARFLAVILCNVILISFVRAGIYTHLVPLSVFIPQTIVTNIIQLPIQSVIGYIALLILKKLRKKFDF